MRQRTFFGVLLFWGTFTTFLYYFLITTDEYSPSAQRGASSAESRFLLPQRPPETEADILQKRSNLNNDISQNSFQHKDQRALNPKPFSPISTNLTETSSSREPIHLLRQEATKLKRLTLLTSPNKISLTFNEIAYPEDKFITAGGKEFEEKLTDDAAIREIKNKIDNKVSLVSIAMTGIAEQKTKHVSLLSNHSLSESADTTVKNKRKQPEGKATKTLKTLNPKDVKRVIPTSSSKKLPWKPRKILLFTYSRSGSSLTGNVIDRSPDVFYVFEPLKQLAMISEGSVESVARYSARSVALCQAFFTCNFSLSLLPLMHTSFLSAYNDTAKLGACVRLAQTSPPPPLQDLTACPREAEAACRTYGRVALKSIRLSMSHVQRLLTLNLDLAVLFLIRDPRATTWSRMNVFKTPHPRDVPRYAERYCLKVYQDLKVAREVLLRHPNSLRFVRYEDLADRPKQTFRNIFNWLRLDWSQDIENHILRQTRSSPEPSPTLGTLLGGKTNNNNNSDNAGGGGGGGGRNNNNPLLPPPLLPQHVNKNKTGTEFLKYAYSVTRLNSSEAASQWREDVPFLVSRIVQEKCRDVMPLLGYRLFLTPDTLRDVAAISSRGRFQYVQELAVPGADLSG